jgi:hypothetical protein
MSLTAQDRIELHELMAHYAHAVDVDGREEDLYEIFTPDAVLDSSLTGVFSGRDGLRQFAQVVAGLRSGRIGRHLITNVRVRGDSARAEIKAYYLQISTPLSPQRPVAEGAARGTELTNGGHYDCVAVKRDGRWWLQRRTVRVDGSVQAPESSGITA